MIEDSIKNLTHETLLRLSSQIESLFGIRLDLKLKFDLKGKSTIGQCKKLKHSTYLIRLHEPLLLHYKKVYIDDVLFHEVAHAVQMEIYKNRVKPHGKEWKQIVSMLKNEVYNPKNDPSYSQYFNTHNIKKSKKFEYMCGCDNSHFLTLIRHNRINKGVRYQCNVCKRVLVKKDSVTC